MPASRTRALNRWLNILLGIAVALTACSGYDEGSRAASAKNVAPSSVTAAAPEMQVETVGVVDPLSPPSELGAALYQANCAICHGARGQGGVGPPLADNPNIKVTDYAIAQVLLGGGGMPPFGPRLTDREIAAVVSFVGLNWGNEVGPISGEEVGLQRSGLRPGMRIRPSDGRAEQTAGAGGLTAGERIYAQQGCGGCHGVQGGGGIGPALAGNVRLAEDSFVIDQILHGGVGMPPFAHQLNDEQIAAVASHERTSWGNEFGTISPDQVASRRQASEGQQ
jgi:mono/diheme cytochrome c family protein